MTPAFYLPLGPDHVRATVLTRGPWHADHQHGGPPTALLVRAAERLHPERHVARLTVELQRPVPLGDLHVHAATVRAGRRTALVEASVACDGTTCLVARLLLVTPAPVALAPPQGAPCDPSAFAPWSFPFFRWDEGYHQAVEVRVERGTFGRGDMTAWMRPRVPLVAGEATSAAAALAVVVDAASGVAAAADPARLSFVNADLSVSLTRPPRAGWVRLAATTTLEPNGQGLADTALGDPTGPLGRATQTLILAPR